MTDHALPSAGLPTVEFWFEFGSNYSYLSVMRIEEAAHRRRVRIIWRPFLLGPIFRALGFETSPFILHKEKGAYMQQDMARLCRKYGLAPWRMPSVFPRSGVLPSRIVLLGAEQPWVGGLSRRVMELNFAHDEDINHPDQITPILSELGLPGSDILAQAQSDSVKSQLRERTEEARTRGIFGAPTFFVGAEMFWGNDRLDDALLFASERD
jgi:2-hydroxychromene-2-carboxylate isomerase